MNRTLNPGRLNMSGSSLDQVALIGDPDFQFLQKIYQDSRSLPAQHIMATSKAEFEAQLKEQPERYSGIFLNPRLSNPSGVPLVRIIREHCPNTPIYLIYDGSQVRLTAAELSGLTVRDTFQKPITCNDINNTLKLSGTSFDPKAALALKANVVEILDVEFAENDNDFSPIRAKSFLAGRESYFDVYVRLNKEKYVKILGAGDSFSPQRMQVYLEKGVECFFIRKAVREQYLRYCDSLANAILNNASFSSEVKVAQVMNWGEESAKFLRAGGLNEGAVNYSRRYAKSVHSLVKKLNLEKYRAISNHIKNNPHFEHSVSILMISSLLSIPLKLDSERSESIVGLAALMHDIGLDQLDKRFHSEEESAFDAEELKVYHSHPLLGQQLLSEVDGIEPVVIQAIGQHHERRNGKGFPHKLGPGRINLVAEVIGLSEEILKQIERSRLDPSLNMMKELEKACADSFSASTFATVKVFF